ncbi:N(2)-citryl-N(6)-acetyl-N(6)-hydroxylysine synthase [Streptomyces sp. YIM 130001]|uniref:IucA/IucC family protein n=1 Tax=Streptomyces sp. YIM 130001 TaxID=2259644 RepID=UPI000EC73244|nr:IucA/IucC family protein [Streptomyces sp. YIM 130001]RII09457.1 N(2)-citryl-N(6)-acetyl-N(6)-hydroxylysine synthase [Streptomyces sp. YIM 130001]
MVRTPVGANRIVLTLATSAGRTGVHEPSRAGASAPAAHTATAFGSETAPDVLRHPMHRRTADARARLTSQHANAQHQPPHKERHLNLNTTPDGRHHDTPSTLGSTASVGTAPLVADASAVPRQKGIPHHPSRPPGDGLVPPDDLLEHPDPRTAAESAAVENLLRCWIRENNYPAPSGALDESSSSNTTPGAPSTLRIPLTSSGTALTVPVRYWSATGAHRLGPPRLEGAPPGAPAADAVTVATLLTREATGVVDRPETDTFRGDGGDLAGRVADSVRRTATFLKERRGSTGDAADAFLAAEQALTLGHPLHPTPKSREGLSDAESLRYSPELRGSFPLHWYAVHPAALAEDSAWTERGRTISARRLTDRIAGHWLDLPDGHAALPLHPWQARELRHRPEVAELFDAGLLRDLGPQGEPWFPTSSVRTLYRPGAAAMLKLSLGLRITNSRRENLHKELRRGVEMHRLLRSGLADQWKAAHPGFDIVRDPAWLCVTEPGGAPLPGLDVMIRNNPFVPGDNIRCLAGLVSPRPVEPDKPGEAAGHPGQEHCSAPMRSALEEIISCLAARTGRPQGAVAAEWFLRYLEHVVRPVLWFDSEAGVALEAHQQNTLVVLDPEGWPTGGRYRDNQGYYFRESRRDELDQRLPGVGVDSDTFVPDAVTDERFVYYLGINNVLGLIGALGAQGLADEQLLIAAFRRFLTGVNSVGRKPGSSFAEQLLESSVLRCKANLLTRVHGLDELVGPVDTQSVYVTITNPLQNSRT